MAEGCLRGKDLLLLVWLCSCLVRLGVLGIELGHATTLPDIIRRIGGCVLFQVLIGDDLFILYQGCALLWTVSSDLYPSASKLNTEQLRFFLVSVLFD